MGRRKIELKKISSNKFRSVTFHKRKLGIVKKCIELAILCEAEVSLQVLFNDKLLTYSSSPTLHTRVEDILSSEEKSKTVEKYTNTYLTHQNEDGTKGLNKKTGAATAAYRPKTTGRKRSASAMTSADATPSSSPQASLSRKLSAVTPSLTVQDATVLPNMMNMNAMYRPNMYRIPVSSVAMPYPNGPQGQNRPYLYPQMAMIAQSNFNANNMANMAQMQAASVMQQQQQQQQHMQDFGLHNPQLVGSWPPPGTLLPVNGMRGTPSQSLHTSSRTSPVPLPLQNIHMNTALVFDNKLLSSRASTPTTTSTAPSPPVITTATLTSNNPNNHDTHNAK